MRRARWSQALARASAQALAQALAQAMALALALAQAAPAAAETPFRLGVQTHFEQGWPEDLASRARDLGAVLLRDEIAWSEAEAAAGSYDFSAAERYLARLRAEGLQLQLVTMDANPLYDQGMTPHSAEGRQAYARYLAALSERYGDVLTEIELGNEVNSGEFLRGPYKDDPARNLAAQARAVRAALPAGQRLICAGTNAVATGFLRDFFRLGGLEACDGISVHPYRDNPETLDLELARLRDLMEEMGGVKPIYATEFGKWVDDPAEAGPWMLKMVAVMGAAGVAEAVWYALLDEPYWPNMGLLTPEGEEKPAAATFRLLQQRLLPLGRPEDLSPSRRSRVYGFGGQAFVLWGSGAALTVQAGTRAIDASGAEIAPPARLGDDPIILFGERDSFRLDETTAAHDQLMEFGTPPWSYYARRPGIGLTPLEIIDDRWGPYRSARDLAPLRISDEWLTTARFEDGPFHVVERFTAPAAGRYEISGWWQGDDDAPPTRLTLWQSDREIAVLDVTPKRAVLAPQRVTLAAGESLDFDLAPAGDTGAGWARRRISVSGPLQD